MPKILEFEGYPDMPLHLQRAEVAHNNLVRARLNAHRTEEGLVAGYDDLQGRLAMAETLTEYETYQFPELMWRIREARIFLGTPGEIKSE